MVIFYLDMFGEMKNILYLCTMIEVDIKNKTEKDATTVELFIDGKEIPSGEDPITNYAFWRDIEDQTQRALYRLKTHNPKMKFDFSLQSMAMTEEEKQARFLKHLKGKFPALDVEKVNNLVTKAFGEISLTGPDDNHPNPFMLVPVDSQFNRLFIASILNQFLTEQ